MVGEYLRRYVLYNNYFRKETITPCQSFSIAGKLYNNYFRKETITPKLHH